ncbi:MAG: DNA mismatch repair protein MutS [Candidatus Marinimicrobia bacterium]|nr:DNA mismatch repair protein MutS [Candidatus Neomarinimicrobiota bacterium]MDD5582598.1 DNA mismatch repair protein MutS [Candidatus Neomarinimicrobiota bacterium]
MIDKEKLTPLMRQYKAIKAKHPDKIVLFRMGDFYETFENDAKIASRVLGITLTKRSNGKAADTPLAGFPHHALDAYLHKLLKAGLKVAICEQLEDPKFAKGLVKRDITEIVTPGIAVNDKFLNSGENNFLGSLWLSKDQAVLTMTDISTGEFFFLKESKRKIQEYFNSSPPSELLYSDAQQDAVSTFVPHYKGLKTSLPDWIFDPIYGREQIHGHFRTLSLKGLSLEEGSDEIRPIGAVLHYIKENFKRQLAHITSLRRLHFSDFMGLDQYTIRNLELFQRLSGETGEGTFLHILDHTKTAMGARLLRNWILQPLQDINAIDRRLNYVSHFLDEPKLLENVQKILQEIPDLERLTARLSSGKINPREIVQLGEGIKQCLSLGEILKEFLDFSLCDPHTLHQITEKIDQAFEDNPPIQLSDGHVFRDSWHEELKELRKIAYHGRDFLISLQSAERERLGIPSLKVSYNRVFGYYIEVTKPHAEKIPPEYIRKQTLVNSERYITPKLKDYEEKILTAEEKLLELETSLFKQFIEGLLPSIGNIQNNARLIAEVDTLACFAVLASQNQWVRPEVTEDTALDIKGGIHPVVQALLPPGESFIPNDVYVDTEKEQILIITGPNMAGKSTYLRQIGLIVLMAHMGCFVPAVSAHIGRVDKIFTRVGASDNLAFGESTFLTEMIETANILNTATKRSLILLDEIGRGTSTYDGLSIAWAVVEYLHNSPEIAARTLFATHYHELTELEKFLERLKNYNVAVREYGDQVVFLRKIVPGGSDKSYGIHVAQMAGIPLEVVNRAKEILHNISGNDHILPNGEKMLIPSIRGVEKAVQLNIFEPEEHEIIKEVKTIKIEEMTPLEALQKLNELKKKL